MNSSIDNILNETDLKLIPPNIRTIIDNYLEGRSKILDLEKQRSILLEKDYNELKIKIDYQSDLMNRYKGHITQLEDDLHKSRRELCDSIHDKDCLNVEIKNLNLELNSRDEHLNRLNELIASKNEETINLIETNRKLQIDLDQLRKETNSSELNEQHFNNLINEKEKLFGLECNFLKTELDRITNDFHEKSSKLNSLTSEMTTFKNETEIKLNDLKKENVSSKNQNTFLNSLIEKKDAQINDLATKLNELHQHQDLLKEQYNIEKKEQNDLINYYKKLLEDSKQQKTVLIDKIKELHESFTESNENQRIALDKLNEQSLRHAEEIKFKDEIHLELQQQIEDLKLQLINLNQKEVDGAMKQFYPTSNTLSKMFEKNMPLSSVYSKYEEAEAKCEELLNENEELKLKIEEIISESEKNAPLIFYKTQENKKAYAEIENYKLQLSKVSSDLENALSEIENYNKMNNYLKRELKRYEKSNVDLTRQVQCLIQTVHEIKGNFVSTKFLLNDETLEKESSFDRAISLNLVTFKNIEEIHENNQKLLATIRELSEQHQELQDKYHNGDDQMAKKHIDELLVELENLKEENRHKQEILSEMMAERETNLNTSGKHDTSMMKEKQGSTLFKVTSRAYLEEKIVELTSNLDKKIEEFDQFKKKTKAQEDELKNQIKEHLELISNYQNEISKLSVKLDAMNENHKVLDSTLARYNKDMGLLKERNIKLEEQRKTLKERIGTFESKKNELIAKLEEIKKDLDSKNEHLNLLEKENDHLKLEKSMLKSRIDELKADLKESNKELNNLNATSQIEPVRIQTELKAQIQILEIKLTNLESQISNLLKEKKESNEKYSAEIKNLQASHLTLKQRLFTMTKEKLDLNKELERISKLHKESIDRLTEIQNSTDDGNKNKFQKSLLVLKNQLEDKKKEIIKLTAERNEIIDKCKKIEERYNFLKQRNEHQVEHFEKAVVTRVEALTSGLKKQLEESNLREKMLKKCINQRDKDLKLANEKLTKLQQQSSIENEQQQQSLLAKLEQQQHAISMLSTNKPITASIKPLQTINRSQSNTIPQATISPQTQTTISSSPQTVYVAPTPVEMSNVESISSSIASTSFLATSSNIQTSNLEQQQFTPSSSSNQLKRSRIESIEDANFKKIKMNLIATPSQQIDSNSSSKNDQIEQVISSSLNDQEIVTEEQQLQESTTDNQIADEQLPQTSKEAETCQKSENIFIDENNPKETDVNSLIESNVTVESSFIENNVQSNLDQITETQEQQTEEANDLSMIVQQSEVNEQETGDDESEESNEGNNELDEEMSGEESDEEDHTGDEEEEYDEDEEEGSNDVNQNAINEENQQTQDSQNNGQDRDDSDIICLSEGGDSQDAEDEADLNQQTDSKNTNEESNLNEPQNYEEENEAIKNLVFEGDYNPSYGSNYQDGVASQSTTKDEHQLDDQSESVEQQSLTNQPNLSMPLISNLSKAMPFVERDQNIDYEGLNADDQSDLDQPKLIINIEPPVETTESADNEASNNEIDFASMARTEVSTTMNLIQNQLIDQAQEASTSADNNDPTAKNQNKKPRSLKRPQIALKNQIEQAEQQPQKQQQKKYSIFTFQKKDKSNDGN